MTGLFGVDLLRSMLRIRASRTLGWTLAAMRSRRILDGQGRSRSARAPRPARDVIYTGSRHAHTVPRAGSRELVADLYGRETLARGAAFAPSIHDRRRHHRLLAILARHVGRGNALASRWTTGPGRGHLLRLRHVEKDLHYTLNLRWFFGPRCSSLRDQRLLRPTRARGPSPFTVPTMPAASYGLPRSWCTSTMSSRSTGVQNGRRTCARRRPFFSVPTYRWRGTSAQCGTPQGYRTKAEMIRDRRCRSGARPIGSSATARARRPRSTAMGA